LRANRLVTRAQREQEQILSCYEFLQQFSAAEQAQLMGLLESLVSQG
jgi:hypothetical protein